MFSELLAAAASVNWALTFGTAPLFALISRFGLVLLLVVLKAVDVESPESSRWHRRAEGVLHLGAVVLAVASVVVAFVGEHGMPQSLAGAYYGLLIGLVLAPLLVFIDSKRDGIRLRPIGSDGMDEPTTWTDLAWGSVGLALVALQLTAPILLLWWSG